MFNAFLHGGRRLISTSWSWDESFRKLCMTQNVHIVVVELYNMHTKCSTCDVACQKILQGTENIKDTSDMSKWVVLPFPTKARVCVATVKACMQAERYKRYFLQLATFFHIDEMPFVACSCTKQTHVCQFLYEVKEENRDIFVWESDENGWPGNVKVNENDPVAWQSWCVDPWSKCAMPTPLVALS